MAGTVKGPILHHGAKFCEDPPSRFWGIAIFGFSNMAAAAILDFQKIRNLNGLSSEGAQCALSCQFLSKSVQWLQKYRDFTVF